ncbi:MAG: hydrogenase nickel incorporation protein HypB [Desulfobacterales bacterium]|nr:hydrogenase nickel incorporation protein HypB [Desulfobacterales bacterium]
MEKKPSKTIEVRQSVTLANDRAAGELRDRFAAKGVWVLNLISSPGAGKTALIEKTVENLRDEFSILVIEGDPHTSLDSDRINRMGARALQINTLGGCHLDAAMIGHALLNIDLEKVAAVFIENVGNLLCPAAWDLGQDATCVLAGLTEGPDKPLKYPETFSLADVLVINKTDLAPYLPGASAMLLPNALKINPGLTVFETSCIDGSGLLSWYDWVKDMMEKKQGGRARA